MPGSRNKPQTTWVRGPDGPLASVVLPPSPRELVSTAESILFLHPTNLNSRCWLPTARLMPGYRRILLDSRGHGSSHMHGPFAVADYAADVARVIQTFELDRVHLVGASLGGSIACAVAGTMQQRVASIVALGAALEPADPRTLASLEQALRTSSLSDVFETFLAHEIAHGLTASEATEARIEAAFEIRNPDMVRTITWGAFAEDARHYAQHVTCATYVLTGEFDLSCPSEAGRRMAAAVNGNFELLPALGHLAMLQDSALIARKISNFIQEVRFQ